MSFINIDYGETKALEDSRGLTLENNNWGQRDSGAQGYQKFWYEHSNQDFGWQWHWHNGLNNKVTAYPEVIYGNKPWSRQPALGQVHNLAQLQVDFSFDVYAPERGGWNAAFEVWLTDIPQISHGRVEDRIATEVMIWLAHDADWAIQPLGRANRIQSWDAYGLDLFEHLPNDPQKWPVYSYVFRNPFTQGSIDWRWYLSELANRRKISTNNYVTSVEFGNEIINSQGQTTVTQFDVGFSLIGDY